MMFLLNHMLTYMLEYI